MKNAFYINCIADPWIKIAQRLKEAEGLEPVYWNGFALMDDSDKLVSEAFPGIIYCEDSCSWRGIFPKEIEERIANTPIDIDFLRKYASEELQAMKMFDRLDWDLYSINFQERQRLYRNMIRGWLAAIEWLKPSVVISQTIPHHISDYALYLLCQYKHIPYIFPERSNFPGRFVLPETIYTIGDVFDKAFDSALMKTDEELLASIPADILDYYNRLKKDYAIGAPAFMANVNKESRQYASLWGLIRHFIGYFRSSSPHQSLFGKNGMLRHGVIVVYRKNREWIENSRFSLWKYCTMYVSAGRHKEKLLKYYRTFVQKPDLKDEYVLYGLHYQPEATSCPGGDIFVDQRLAIDLLLKNTPENYKVYVKEHPHQFLKQRDGQTSRIKEFYEDLAKNPRIKLLDITENTFDLIQHAKAVATITGTIGWESIVYKKPVIGFGISWYEAYPGVLRITDEKSANGIFSFIQSYKYDEHSLLAYLSAVGEKTYKAYSFYSFLKEIQGMTEEECIDKTIVAINDSLRAHEEC